jgi:glyoxylase-like metal-dependent hydrolase (beta-lactamase superfamily II)
MLKRSNGSISVLIDDGRVIAGDLVSSGIMLGGIMFKDKPKQPPFEESPLLVAQSLRLLLAEGSSLFHLGHGGPLGPKPICKHIARLQAFSKTAEGRSG